MQLHASCFLNNAAEKCFIKNLQETILAILNLKEQLFLTYKKSSQKIVRDVLLNVEVSNKGGTIQIQ